MIKINALLLSLFLLACTSYAQQVKVNHKVFKYGKVDLTEFDTKVSGVDSAASAVVLFDVGKGYFDFTAKGLVYVQDRHTRYKIINKNGYDYGNLELQFYKSQGNGTSLDQLDAATYNLENGKIVTSKINKDAKFTEKQDKNFTLKKFALPNVKEGSIIEYKYKIISDFIFTLRPWYFQRDIPTLYSEFTATIPEYYRYRQNANGFLFLNPTQENVNQSFNGATLNCRQYNFIVENAPGLKKESFITTMQDYVSRVNFELTSITVPGEAYKEFTTTWPKLVAGLKTEEKFGQFVDKKSFIKSLLKGQIKGDQSNKDSMLVSIFNYVKNNIKWNKETELYTSETNPKAIFEKKAGNSADINLCLYALLKEADIAASLILISTRDNGAHPGLPMLTAFNNVIVGAKIGENVVMLDATDKNHCVDLISYSNLNHQGLQVDLENESAQWVSTDDNKISKKNINYVLTMDNEHKLSGKLYLSSSNYEGLARRDQYLSAANETDFLKDYKSDKPGLGIKNYEVTNLNNPSEPLIESMDVEIEDNVEEAGNLAYFTPLLFERTKENPFKLEERKFPVDFGFPSEEIFRMTIEFPKDYQLDKMPKNEKIILPDETAAFTFMFAAEDNRIMLNSKITVKKPVFTAEEYYDLKELFKNIVRKQAEQIVLKKI
ncbi:DUF3857 domain-containing protein [Pedobacter frigoris]|uniref:DUF3857 domain-containing protein n=1 Tax=Pedobacter frigoris TaxID=2571272 RepID=A0A4V5NZL4_9SPHI|nr:DUF3857 domain-containing protein [Pedobacter frigoris]TKC09062.1 DUF3857 domain-containing protein [Pedobacter frigoris]